MLNAAEPGNTATGSDAVRPASAASGKAAPKTPATGSNAEYQVDEDGHILDGMVFDDVTEKSFVPTVSYVDEFGEPLTGHYTDVELPGFGETLVLDDPENAPVDDVVVRSGFLNMHRTTFSYLYATADGARIREIRKTTSTEEVELEIPDDSTRSNASRATADDAERILEVEKEVYAYTADGEEWTEITEDTELLFVFAQEGLTSYVYEDDDITVTAQLQYEDAIPAGVELKVTPITEKSTGYNYDAYMQALNDNAAKIAAELKDSANAGDPEIPEEAEKGTPVYNKENTLLYDIAFIKTENDGTEIEYEPEQGSVRVVTEFRQNQLSGTLGASAAEDIQVIHLPLKEEVRAGVDNTQEASEIRAEDIEVKTVKAEIEIGTEMTAEKAEFKTDSFSTFAYSNTGVQPGTEGKLTVNIQFYEDDGITPAVNAELTDKVYYLFITGVALKENGQTETGYVMLPIPKPEDGVSTITVDKLGKGGTEIGSFKDNSTYTVYVYQDMKYLDDGHVAPKKYPDNYPDQNDMARIDKNRAYLGGYSWTGEKQPAGNVFDISAVEGITDETSYVNPDTILGRAVEYGILANKYTQKNHTETNWAVNQYVREGDQVTDPDLATNTGDVTTTGYPFLMTEMTNGIRFGQHAKGLVDIHISDRYAGRAHEQEFINDAGAQLTIRKFFRSQNSVKADVDRMINKIKDESDSLCANHADISQRLF